MKKMIYFWLSLLIIMFFANPYTVSASGNISYTSKTYKFSFSHSDKYLNRYEKYSIKIDDPTDPEDATKFTEYINGDSNYLSNSFSYKVNELDQPIYIIKVSPDDRITYNQVNHGTLTDANGTTYPTTSNQKSSFNPQVYYIFVNSKLNRVVDSSKDLEGFDAETRRQNHQLVKITSTIIKPYSKNKKGITFYQLNKGLDGGYGNLYCAVGNKVICFDVKINNLASKIGDKIYKSNLSLEKKIMDPIIKSFLFTEAISKPKIPEDEVAKVKSPITFVPSNTNLGTDDDEYVISTLGEIVDNSSAQAKYHENSYKGFCKKEQENISKSFYLHGFNVLCFDSVNNFAYSINLPKNLYYCVDDTGVGSIIQNKITGPKCNQ